MLSLLHGLSHSCNARTSIPMPTVFLALLSTSFTFAVTIATIILLLLLLSHYCFHHITVTTNKLCQVRCFSGATELTTQLLRLINILWLPLCRINKLGYIYPRRLLRSPTLVGHQDAIARAATSLVVSFSSSSSSDNYSSWVTNTILEDGFLLEEFLLKNGFLLGILDLSLRTSLPACFSLGS